MKTSRNLPTSLAVILLLAPASVGAGVLAPAQEMAAGPAWTVCKEGTAEGSLAGPLADEPGIIFHRYQVPSDGAVLDVGVYRPNVSGKVPVVAIVGPYFGNSHPTIGRGLSDEENDTYQARWLRDQLLPKGYAIALASVRGTGCSTGCFTMGDEQERRDVARIVDFLGDGARGWSNGNVALTGLSYAGTTPWEGAAVHPEHLRTIVPLEGLPDMYRYSFRNGTTYAGGGTTGAFALYYPVVVDWGTGFDKTPSASRLAGGQVDQAAPNVIRACTDEATLAVGGAAGIATGSHDAFWDERDSGSRLTGSTLPILLGIGLMDGNVKPDTSLYAFQGMVGPKKVFLGPWDHAMPKTSGGPRDWATFLTAWFDRWLKDVPNGIENGSMADYNVTGGGAWEWRTSSSWPPADAEMRRLYLTDHLGLAEQPPTGGALSLGASFVSSLGGVSRDTLVLRSGPIDPHHRVALAGIPKLNLDVLPHTPGGQIYADLQVVNATTGAAGQVIDWTVVDLAHARSVHERDAIVPEQPMHVTMEFFSLAKWVMAGDGIQLRLSTGTDRVVAGIPGNYEIELGASTLELPIVP